VDVLDAPGGPALELINQLSDWAKHFLLFLLQTTGKLQIRGSFLPLFLFLLIFFEPGKNNL
jgi:hypothetical protein